MTDTSPLNTDAPLCKRLLAADESVPYGWTVVYSGPDYQVIAMPERRSTERTLTTTGMSPR